MNDSRECQKVRGIISYAELDRIFDECSERED